MWATRLKTGVKDDSMNWGPNDWINARAVYEYGEDRGGAGSGTRKVG
jgi:hypothetical protein